MAPISDFKSHLASEISSFSTRTVSCPHRHFSPPFLDWYRLLGVQQDAGIDSIRRRYLNLALQLHPDKNSHPKAEFAFKLVSEGYACLSDNVKRRAFDLDRMKKFCPDCNTIPYRKFSYSPKNLNDPILNEHGGFRDMKDRLREEANVIENCLRANNSAAAATTTTKETASLFNSPGCLLNNNTNFHHRNYKETPIFNPSDYVCQGYPHFRARIHPKPQSFRCFRTGNSLKYEQGRGKYEYPVFEIRSENFLVQKQSAFVYSNVNKSHW